MEFSTTLTDHLRESIQSRFNIDGEQLRVDIHGALAKQDVAAMYYSDVLLDFVATSDTESCDLSFIEQAFSPMFDTLNYQPHPAALYDQLVPPILLHARVVVHTGSREYCVYIPCRTLVLLEALSQ